MDINQIDLIVAISSEIEKRIPGIPAEPRYMNAIIKAANLVCDEFKKPLVKASEGMGLAAWLASDDVGASSKYMASVLSGQFSAPNHYPLDDADLGRCTRLLVAVPELASQLNEMKACSPQCLLLLIIGINGKNFTMLVKVKNYIKKESNIRRTNKSK